MKNRPTLIALYRWYSPKRRPETRNPLSTKKRSTPIQPESFHAANAYLCAPRTSRMAIALRVSRCSILPDGANADGFSAEEPRRAAPVLMILGNPGVNGPQPFEGLPSACQVSPTSESPVGPRIGAGAAVVVQ